MALNAVVLGIYLLGCREHRVDRPLKFLTTGVSPPSPRSRPRQASLVPRICRLVVLMVARVALSRLRTLARLARYLRPVVLRVIILPSCLRPPKLSIDRRLLRAFPRLYLTLRCLTMVVSRLPLVPTYRPSLDLCPELFVKFKVPRVRPREIPALSFPFP